MEPRNQGVKTTTLVSHVFSIFEQLHVGEEMVTIPKKVPWIKTTNNY